MKYSYCYTFRHYGGHHQADFQNILKEYIWIVQVRSQFLQTYLQFSLSLVQSILVINLLKPTGYVMHQQFNIQQLYALLTLYLCVLYLSENKQRLVPLTA